MVYKFKRAPILDRPSMRNPPPLQGKALPEDLISLDVMLNEIHMSAQVSKERNKNKNKNKTLGLSLSALV